MPAATHQYTWHQLRRITPPLSLVPASFVVARYRLRWGTDPNTGLGIYTAVDSPVPNGVGIARLRQLYEARRIEVAA